MRKQILTLFVFLLVLTLSFSVFAAESYSGKLTVNKGSNGVIVISGPGQSQQFYCGDGIRQISLGEQCDGSDLAGQTCSSLVSGTTGSLSCKADCTWNTAGCQTLTQPPGGDSGTGGTGGSGSGGSSGGSGAVTLLSSCVESWQCTDWTPCVSGTQIRNCNDNSRCGTTNLKPEEQRGCTEENDSGANSKGGITGAVIGALGMPGMILVIAFIVAVIALAIMVAVRNRKK